MYATKQKVAKNVIGMWAALKGLMVIAVVLGHSINDAGQICNMFVYPIPFRVVSKASSFVLFTFFIISGHLFKPKKRGIGRQYCKYWLIYIVTALFMTFAAVLNDFITGTTEPNAPSLLLGCLYGASDRLSLFGHEIQPPYALWFFAVFMNSWIMLELFMRIKRESVRALIIFGVPLLFFAVCICIRRPGGFILVDWPFYLIQTCIATMLLYIGYLITKNELLFKNIKWYWIAIIMLVALGTFVLGKVDMMRNGYRLNALDCFGCICGAFFVMYWYIRVITPDNRLLEPLMWIGRRSLLIIPIHCVEGVLFGWMNWDGLSRLGMYGSAFLVFFLQGIVIIIACIMIERLQIRYKKWRQEVKRNG